MRRARQEQSRTRNTGQKASEAPRHKVKSEDEEKGKDAGRGYKWLLDLKTKMREPWERENHEETQGVKSEGRGAMDLGRRGSV